MSIFKNLFQKNESNQNPQIIDLELLTKSYHYVLQEKDSHIAIKVGGIKKPVQSLFLEIPGSFDNEDNKAEMLASNISSSFELFNTYLKKIGMGEVSIAESLDDVAYNFLWIYFETKTRDGETIKKTNHNFFLEPFIEDELIIDFGITYSNIDSENFVEKFLDSRCIDYKNSKNEIDVKIMQQLKKVFDELGEHADADFMFSLNNNSYSEGNPTDDDFKKLLQLISRNQISENDLSICSKQLFQISKREIKPEFNITNTTFDLLENCGFAVFWDYKFDASDLKFNIEQLIHNEFDFICPTEVFSHKLFRFAQVALANLNLELMGLKSYADNYFFIVVNKNEVLKILELSKITKIEIGKLN